MLRKKSSPRILNRHAYANTAATAAYKLGCFHPDKPLSRPCHHQTHKTFRTTLASTLFAKSERLSVKQNYGGWNLADNVVINGRVSDHKLGSMASKKYYVPCLYTGRECKEATTRKVLGELSVNSGPRRRRQRAPRTRFGCELCGIHICDHKQCLAEHIAASELPN